MPLGTPKPLRVPFPVVVNFCLLPITFIVLYIFSEGYMFFCPVSRKRVGTFSFNNILRTYNIFIIHKTSMKNFDTQTIQNLDSLPMPEQLSWCISVVGHCDFTVVCLCNAMFSVIYRADKV